MFRSQQITVPSKKIKLLSNKNLGEEVLQKGETKRMGHFISVCRTGYAKNAFIEKEITIKKPELVDKPPNLDKLVIKDLPFDISKENVMNICKQIIEIMRDPLLVTSLLKDLNEDLGNRMLEHNIQFSDKDYPEYIIPGKGNFMPGPPPEGYLPKKKEELLDKLLREFEQSFGINVEDTTAKFAGYVEPEVAEKFIASGHLFSEEKQVGNLLLHGSYTHRLMFAALCYAIKNGTLKVQYQNKNGEQVLTEKELLMMLVIAKYDPINLWDVMIDNLHDTQYPMMGPPPWRDWDFQKYLEYDKYSYSCRSPFVLNSLLLCFGKELGLSNLQHYLLDSHWKAAFEMALRVKNSMNAEQSKSIPDSRIYTYIMESFATTHTNPNELIDGLPFTLSSRSNDQLHPKHEPFLSKKKYRKIVQKRKQSPSASSSEKQRWYTSWDEFFQHKQETKPKQIPNPTKSKRNKP